MIRADPLVVAADLRREAEQLLHAIRFPDWTSQYGKIEPAGSYVYDVMSWRDLDCTCRLHPGVDPVAALWDWCRLAQQRFAWAKFNFQNFLGDRKPWWPRGIYLGAQLVRPEFGGEWKVDLWALSPESQTQADELLQDIKARLTPELRPLILSLKHELMQGHSRVPQQRSLALYRAVLWEGLRERDQIFEFLEKRRD